MKKSLCKTVRKAEQDPKEKRWYNLRWTATHLSIDVEKEKGVPSEFKSPEREAEIEELIKN